MADQDAWPHRWFGCWQEDGRGYERCPSVKSWPTVQQGEQEVARVVASLANGQVVCVGQDPGRTCHLCAHQFEPSLAWLSDGVWLWPEVLIHYHREHRLALPEEMRKRLLDQEVHDPDIVDPNTLDWP